MILALTSQQVWDIRAKDCLTTYKGHKGGVTKARFSPDGKMIASGDETGMVKVPWFPPH